MTALPRAAAAVSEHRVDGAAALARAWRLHMPWVLMAQPKIIIVLRPTRPPTGARHPSSAINTLGAAAKPSNIPASSSRGHGRRQASVVPLCTPRRLRISIARPGPRIFRWPMGVDRDRPLTTLQADRVHHRRRSRASTRRRWSPASPYRIADPLLAFRVLKLHRTIARAKARRDDADIFMAPRAPLIANAFARRMPDPPARIDLLYLMEDIAPVSVCEGSPYDATNRAGRRDRHDRDPAWSDPDRRCCAPPCRRTAPRSRPAPISPGLERARPIADRPREPSKSQ